MCIRDSPKEDIFDGQYERELLLFTIKLKALIKLDILRGDIISRIALNVDKLGPLYSKIIDDTIFLPSKEETLTQRRNKGNSEPLANTKQSANDTQDENDAFDPIDSSSQPPSTGEQDSTRRQYEGLEPIEEQSQEISAEPMNIPMKDVDGLPHANESSEI